MKVNKKLSQYTPEEIRCLIRETLSGSKETTEQVKEKRKVAEKEKEEKKETSFPFVPRMP